MKKDRPMEQTAKVFSNDSHFHGLFRYNEFNEDIEFVRSPVWDESVMENKIIEDEDLTQIRFYLTTVHNLEPSKGVVGEVCYISSKRNSYHPLKKYLEKESWDGIPRLHDWIIKAVECVDNAYTRQVGEKFLIAAVNRVYDPGCKFDHMLILEGPQGLGKSTLVEELAGDWYLDTNFQNKDKDLVDCMRSGFLIEISELSGMKEKDVNWLKSFITKKVDRVRLAYAERCKDFKRKSVFIGTYNPSGHNNYFKDDTGNRRFWPIECINIDINYVKNNKHQLWAEAIQRYKEKVKYYIDDPIALEIMKEVHADREVDGPVNIKIKRWIISNGLEEVEMESILNECLQVRIESKSDTELKSIWTTIGIAMKKIGWIKGSNNNRNKYYSPKKLNNWSE